MESPLNRLIHSLSKDEVRHFKLFAQKYDATTDRKDMALFDYIRKAQDRYVEEKIVRELYNGEDKNSFYRLRNRLTSEVSKSLLIQHYDEADLNGVLFHVLLSRIFQQKRDFATAHFFLRRAEKKAMNASAHDLLDLIYGEMVKLSGESLEIDPEEYIQLRKENRLILQKLQEIDDILAVLTYRIRVSQNFTKGDVEVLRLLDRTIKDYSANTEMARNVVFRMKVYQAVSRILLQEHNYVSLEKYLLKTFREFSQEKLFDRNNHDTKLGMLIYLVNSLFKNGKHKESLQYAAELGKAMGEFNGLLKEKYLFYYYNALINNYAVLDKNKAVDTILAAQDIPEISRNKFNRSFLDIQLALQYFDLGEYRKANKLMVKIRHEDNFKIFDAAFQLKILIVELLIRFELKDADFIEVQSPRIKKEYTDLLKDPSYSRQAIMLDLLSKAILVSNIRSDQKLKTIAGALFEAGEELDSADADLIDYHEWVKNKGLFDAKSTKNQ